MYAASVIEANDDCLPPFILEGLADTRIEAIVDLIDVDFGENCKIEAKKLSFDYLCGQKRSEGLTIELDESIGFRAFSIIGSRGQEEFLRVQDVKAIILKNLSKKRGKSKLDQSTNTSLEVGSLNTGRQSRRGCRPLSSQSVLKNRPNPLDSDRLLIQSIFRLHRGIQEAASRRN